MSAAEVIEQIKALPPEERQAVRDFLARDEAGAGHDPAFESAMQTVMSNYAPLMERLAR